MINYKTLMTKKYKHGCYLKIIYILAKLIPTKPELNVSA